MIRVYEDGYLISTTELNSSGRKDMTIMYFEGLVNHTIGKPVLKALRDGQDLRIDISKIKCLDFADTGEAEIREEGGIQQSLEIIRDHFDEALTCEDDEIFRIMVRTAFEHFCSIIDKRFPNMSDTQYKLLQQQNKGVN